MYVYLVLVLSQNKEGGHDKGFLLFVLSAAAFVNS